MITCKKLGSKCIVNNTDQQQRYAQTANYCLCSIYFYTDLKVGTGLSRLAAGKRKVMRAVEVMLPAHSAGHPGNLIFLIVTIHPRLQGGSFSAPAGKNDVNKLPYTTE